MIMKNNTLSHKQYIIDSITEMRMFINKMENNIRDNGEAFSDATISTMRGIIARKKANIAQFKELLKDEYNYVSPVID
jgi:hypothetical protein